MRPFFVALCNKDVTPCFFDKVFGTLTRRFAAPSPRGRGTFCRRVLLPLGEGGAKRRMRALVAASPRYVFVFTHPTDTESSVGPVEAHRAWRWLRHSAALQLPPLGGHSRARSALGGFASPRGNPPSAILLP